MNQLQTVNERDAESSPATGDMKLEVVVVPVSDVDRAKQLLWRLGLATGCRLRRRRISCHPVYASWLPVFGSLRLRGYAGPYARIELDILEYVGELVVSDIEVARAELADRGVDVSEVYHYAGREGRVSGPDPERRSYASWASFSDPAGNNWLLQEVTARAPGRVEADDTTFVSSAELAAALRRASVAHGEHEKASGGQRDENWPDWYAAYMVAEQAGKPLPL